MILNFQILSIMSSRCRTRYTYYTDTNVDCASSSAHHSTASAFYFLSTITAMAVLGAITLLFFCRIFFKRRLITERLRTINMAASSSGSPVLMYVWPGTHDQGAPNSRNCKDDDDPCVSCVIMAGEERPTHLARPLSREDFVHGRLEGKVVRSWSEVSERGCRDFHVRVDYWS